MAINLTKEQYETINNNLIVYADGKTNKKCPICNDNIVIKELETSYVLMCENKTCFSVVCRGV